MDPTKVSIGTKLQQLAALRGQPHMSIVIEGFVNKVMKDSKDGTDLAALNPKQIRCIENEWKDQFA